MVVKRKGDASGVSGLSSVRVPSESRGRQQFVWKMSIRYQVTAACLHFMWKGYIKLYFVFVDVHSTQKIIPQYSDFIKHHLDSGGFK